MIRVTASPDPLDGPWNDYDHPEATGWDNDPHGNLDIIDPGGVIATYRAGTWFRVLTIRDDQPVRKHPAEPVVGPWGWDKERNEPVRVNPEDKAEHGPEYWQHGSPDPA